jgi:UDP-N-acetylglucosamine/UDP-N-acetylgalactosamine diphosphorylase
MSKTLPQRHAAARQTLAAVGQAHLLHYYDQLDDARRAALLDQIEAQDWPALAEAVKTHVLAAPTLHLPSRIEPAPCYPAVPAPAQADRYRQARQIGRDLIRAGQVAAFTVAGGQGTRLGWDAPKGTFPASPILQKPLFQLFAESIAKTQLKHRCVVPWYIMTSPLNDAPTRAFFQQHRFFGLHPDDVRFFPQGVVPSFTLDGKAMLDAPDHVASNPDGHGGSLRALFTSGAVADMERRGVRQISYFQVDNPLVRCVDPLFIGLHVMDQAQMSSKMVAKAAADEKVGNFVLADGKIAVIEYSDLPRELERRTNPDGKPTFNAGSIAIHVIAVDFVKQLNAGRFGLPYHRAVKKVPHLDLGSGQLISPAQPNAVKLETFVFDALPLCDRSIVLETLREDEFGPIKNADGADSPATSKKLQSDRALRWLRQAGVQVAGDAEVDLSPLTAIEPDDLSAAPNLPRLIESGAKLSL